MHTEKKSQHYDKMRTIDDLVRYREKEGMQGPFSPNAYPLIDGLAALDKFNLDHALSRRDALIIMSCIRSGTHPDHGDVPLITVRVEGEALQLKNLLKSLFEEHPELRALAIQALREAQIEHMSDAFQRMGEFFARKAEEKKA